MTAQMTGPGDLRDQRWLDDRIASIADSYESMALAVEDIRVNWSENRCVGRLHPGVAPDDYIRAEVPQLQRDRKAVAALVEYTRLSLTAIAGLTGYAVQTVSDMAGGVSGEPETRTDLAGKPALGGRPRGTTGRPVKRRYPEWWREVGVWLGRARPEDERVLLELDERIHAAMSAIGLEEA